MRKTKFKRLGLLYIIALSAIALSVIASQSLVQRFIGSQVDDSSIINVAGRQRMLSQKISKLVLMARQEPNESTIKELEIAVALWVRSHEGLLEGDEELGLNGKNSQEIMQMFQAINSYYQNVIADTRSFIGVIRNEEKANDEISRLVNSIIENEKHFLKGMDQIVFQYDKEANQKVLLLRRIELILFGISMLIIILELLFIFRPIAKNVAESVEELTKSEKSSYQMAKEITKLYDELVKSYQDLEAVDIKPASSKLFANINQDGDFKSGINEILKIVGGQSLVSFKELLKNNGYSQDFIEGLFNKIAQGENWNGELKLINSDGDFVWLEVFLVTVIDQDLVKIIGKDVTEIKEAKMISREINSEKIAKKVKEQQYRSVLILEGQEEERKRLARELHDGVGQMLSALKMSMESVNVPIEPANNRKRFDHTTDQLKKVIQEIRRISFNLIPNNLVDFGIVPAVKKFCQEVSRLSNITVKFENQSSFINRLEQHVESNLYRIIQEAVNNAIKYSDAEVVQVSFEHTHSELTILIEDNGRGFDLESLLEQGHFKSAGHGIFNMKERAAFINASFKIESSLHNGTKILVSLPLE